MTQQGRARDRDWILALAASALVGATACGQSAAPREDIRRTLLQDLGDQVFLPNYQAFEARAGELEARADALCGGASEETLTAAQEAWWAARAPWKRNDFLAFGPYMDEPMRFGPKIDFWPARVDAIDEVLAGTTPLDAEALEGMGTTQRGLPVIEYLLYEPDADLVALHAPDSRRCEYLRALTADLSALATGIRKAWGPKSGNYLGELVQAGRESEAFDSIEMALGEVVNRLVFTVENVRGSRLGGPLGTRSGGIPQPDSVESRFSVRSIEDVRDSLRGVETVCFGADVPDAQSLASYLEHIGRDDLTPKLHDAFDAGYASLDAIAEPLSESVIAQPAEVQAAIDTLAELQRLIQVDVINAMGLTLTFNDADGD